MRIGSRLFWGFGCMLLLLVALSALGWEGHRRLSAAQDSRVRSALLDADIRALQAGAFAFMQQPTSAALDAVLSRSGMLDQSFASLKLNLTHDMGVRIDRAMRANMEFRGTLEKWQDARDVRKARVADADAAAGEFFHLLDEMAGAMRNGTQPVASEADRDVRRQELTQVNDVQREMYEARLLARDWLLSGDGETVGALRTHVADALSVLADMRTGMTQLTDRDRADTLMAHGRDFLAAFSTLEDAVVSLDGLRATLASAVNEMRAPLNRLADEALAAMDYVRDIGVLSAGGILSLGVFVALVFGVSVPAALRKQRNAMQVALESLAAGQPPDGALQSGTGLERYWGDLAGVVQRMALSETELTKRVQRLADGSADAAIPLRSERDALGLALERLADVLRSVRTGLTRRAEGDYRPVPDLAAVRASQGSMLAALEMQRMFVARQVESARNGVAALTEGTGKAMESVSMVERFLAREYGRDSEAAKAERVTAEHMGEVAGVLDQCEAGLANLRETGQLLAAAVADAGRLDAACSHQGSAMRELMRTGSPVEDVGRTLEALATSMHIELARLEGDTRGLDAALADMRQLAERCREQAGSAGEALYASRRAADDARQLAVSMGGTLRRVEDALSGLPEQWETGIRLLRQHTDTYSGAARNTPGKDEPALWQPMVTRMGKTFNSLIMELNTLRGVLGTFRVAEEPKGVPDGAEQPVAGGDATRVAAADSRSGAHAVKAFAGTGQPGHEMAKGAGILPLEMPSAQPAEGAGKPGKPSVARISMGSGAGTTGTIGTIGTGAGIGVRRNVREDEGVRRLPPLSLDDDLPEKE